MFPWARRGCAHMWVFVMGKHDPIRQLISFQVHANAGDGEVFTRGSDPRWDWLHSHTPFLHSLHFFSQLMLLLNSRNCFPSCRMSKRPLRYRGLSLSHTHAFVFQPDRSRWAAELRAALRLLLSPSLISYSCPSPSLCSPFNLLFLPFLFALISVGAGFAPTCRAAIRLLCQLLNLSLFKKLKIRGVKHIYQIFKSIHTALIFVWFNTRLEVILPSRMKGCLYLTERKHKQLIWVFQVRCQRYKW